MFSLRESTHTERRRPRGARPRERALSPRSHGRAAVWPVLAVFPLDPRPGAHLSPGRPGAAGPLAPKPTLFPARAKRIIFLFMNGGPSHANPFDPKAMLTQRNGGEPPDIVGKTRRGRNQNSQSETDRSCPLSWPTLVVRGEGMTASARCGNRRRIVPLP